MVQCKNCGLLCARSLDTGEYLEVHKEFRDRGELIGLHLKNALAPVCLIQIFNLRQEFETATNNSEPKKRFLEVINLERVCTRHCNWMPSFKPKEHFELMRIEMLEKEIENRRIEDEKRSENQRLKDKEFNDLRLEADRTWQVNQEKIKFRRSVSLGILLGLLTTILAAILAIVVEPWKVKSDSTPHVDVHVPAPQVNVYLAPEPTKKNIEPYTVKKEQSK